MKNILDVCCGSRMFWFDRTNPNVLFVDNRIVAPTTVGEGSNARTFSIEPDEVMDFRALDLPDESFSLVVFDPPHFIGAGDKGWMGQKYGTLDKDTWQDDLAKGFAECFRVLRPNGVLVFKWNEYHIPLKKILALTPESPLFGHPSGRGNRQNTHWVCFMKGAIR